ncbi:cupin-like domain-containing protein [Streptomyces coeruleorubidus]|uniref:cupin-like domain-containing protein n=1 Tax=Streptomyces coeruleorubidus TaxID=116188 RepID=UPI0033F21C25
MAPISPTSLRVLDGSTVTTLEDIDGPVVIRGLQDEWRARELWTVDHFRHQYGGLRVPVREYPAGSEYEYTLSEDGLADFLDYWEKSRADHSLARDRRYLAEWNFVRDCPGLLDDFSIPAIFSDDWIDRLPEQVRFGRMWIFFGEPGCSTGLHCDTFSTSAWLAVLAGSKELRLVTPEAGRALRADDSLWSERTHDEVLRKSAGPLYEVTLRAGDTLYIPGDWYHEVRNPERNLMLTANFVEERKLLSFLAQFETRLTEPLSVLRQARNAQIRTWAGGDGRHDELAREEFRARQLDWVRAMTSDLREYERALLEWDAPGAGATEAPNGAR